MLALSGQSTVSNSKNDYACEVRVELLSRVDPWSPNPATDSLLPFWQEAATTLGVKVIREERGGLSDGNHIWRQIPTLDGLGPGGGNAHCSEQSADGSKEQEYANRSSFVPKALLNSLAILNLISAAKL
jgi:glutamate carboxypeptidase